MTALPATAAWRCEKLIVYSRYCAVKWLVAICATADRDKIPVPPSCLAA